MISMWAYVMMRVGHDDYVGVGHDFYVGVCHDEGRS